MSAETKPTALAVTGGDLISALLGLVRGTPAPTPEPEAEIREWIARGYYSDQDIQWRYDPAENLYSCVHTHRDGVEAATGYGPTEAQAMMNMEEKLVDWFA